MNSEQPPPVADLRDRLNAVVSWAVPGRGRFRVLHEQSGISQESWKATWHNKQRPTSDMIQFVARAWPECAFWLATGVTDQRHGHRAPDNIQTYPESVCSPRTVAAKYFRQQIEMRQKHDDGEPELFEHILLLRSLDTNRDLDEASCEEADAVKEETFIAGVVQGLDKDSSKDRASATAPGQPSRTARFLAALQAQRELSDAEMAKLLDREPEDLEAIRAGGLDAGATGRIFDAWAYDKIRDALLGVLPDEWARDLRRRDIERGRRRIQRKVERP